MSPLRGIKVLDVSALGPGPFASMLLSDYGADVVAVERPRNGAAGPEDVSDLFNRGKRCVTVDLRGEHGSEVVRRLASAADVFLEGYRPGTMERRGLGPEVLLADNPRLIYTRLTGWGQSGPYSPFAGHDINYIAIGGVLGVVGDKSPVPPLNLLGDFAGGSLMAVTGTVLALFERERTGRGQVVDAAMVDGAALLVSAQLAEHSRGAWRGRGQSLLSGKAPFYGVYRCSDGAWFSVGAIEAKFYVRLLDGLGLPLDLVPLQYDETSWDNTRTLISDIFSTRPRQHWEAVFMGTDACAFPVREIAELADDPHLRSRGTVIRRGGAVAAAAAPRLSVTPPAASATDQDAVGDARSAFADFGVGEEDLDRYVASGTVTLGAAPAGALVS